MSFHGLEHFCLVSVVDQSVIACAYSTTLLVDALPCGLGAAEATSALAARKIIGYNLLFAFFGRIVNGRGDFIRTIGGNMDLVLFAYVGLNGLVIILKSLIRISHWSIELGCATIEWLLIILINISVPHLISTWRYFFTHLVGRYLLTSDILWLASIGKAFVLRMAMAALNCWLALSARKGEVCWSSAYSMNTQLHIKILHLGRINSLGVIWCLVKDLEVSSAIQIGVIPTIIAISCTHDGKIALTCAVCLNIGITALRFYLVLHFRIYPITTLSGFELARILARTLDRMKLSRFNCYFGCVCYF